VIPLVPLGLSGIILSPSLCLSRRGREIVDGVTVFFVRNSEIQAYSLPDGDKFTRTMEGVVLLLRIISAQNPNFHSLTEYIC